ncbi:hypothetical protein L1987_33440 [Smallanthus sonchifolius]|uniref:Uncharacterized protein n=1 Tax=Smallanthus sonchifolius TaxID=185202 RepID=A0ACB9HRQ9_9ASTR|nr:hypothetical protein L1987_33440 [Smallanthus sonchifolius]
MVYNFDKNFPPLKFLPRFLLAVHLNNREMNYYLVSRVNVKGKSAFEALSILQGPSETSLSSMEIVVWYSLFKVQRQLIAKTPVFYRLEQMENVAKAPVP